MGVQQQLLRPGPAAAAQAEEIPHHIPAHLVHQGTQQFLRLIRHRALEAGGAWNDAELQGVIFDLHIYLLIS